MRSHDAAVAAAIVALIIAVIAVLSTSRASVSATTENDSNLWASANVAVDASGTSGLLLTGTNLFPGLPTEGCAVVVYRGTAANVDIHTYSVGSKAGLAPFVTLMLEVGAGSSRDCDDFTPTRELYNGPLTAFLTNHTSYPTGLTLGTEMSPGDRVMVRGVATIGDDNAAQGQETGFELVFEVRP